MQYGFIKNFWLPTSWFTYSQNGSLWLQKWGLFYFSGFIPEASKTTREHQQCPHYVPNSTLQCLTKVHSRTIVGPLLFNINDLFYFIKKDAQLLNFADDNTITTFSNSIDDLITYLQKESENVIDWFRSNEMVVNPHKSPNPHITVICKKLTMPCHTYISTLNFRNGKFYLAVLYYQISALSQKAEKVQEWALRLLYNDSFSS